MHCLELHSVATGSLAGFFEDCICWGFAAPRRGDVLAGDMDAGEAAARNLPHKLAGQFQGVVSDPGAIDGHHHPVDVADVKVVAHQQHRPGRELEYVLAGAVAEDRLEAAQASGAHHDQVAVEFVGHLQHRLLGVSLPNDRVHLAGVEPEPLHGFGGDSRLYRK